MLPLSVSGLEHPASKGEERSQICQLPTLVVLNSVLFQYTRVRSCPWYEGLYESNASYLFALMNCSDNYC